MLGIPSPPAHGGSWAVSKSTTVFFWYPFFQMKSFTAFCSVLIRFSSNCGMIWTTWVNFDSASVLAILILPYTVRFLYCHLLNMELTSPSLSSKLLIVRAGSAMRLIPRILSSFTHLRPRSGARLGISAAPPILSTCVLPWFIVNPDILENRFRTSVAALMLPSSYGMIREQSSANASALIEMAGSGRACLVLKMFTGALSKQYGRMFWLHLIAMSRISMQRTKSRLDMGSPCLAPLAMSIYESRFPTSLTVPLKSLSRTFIQHCRVS